MGLDINPDGVNRWFDWLGRSQFVAALAGGFIAAFKSQTPGATFVAKMLNGVGGTLFAMFTGQLAAAWIGGITHPWAIAGIIFVCGLVGMALTDSLLKAIAELRLGTAFNDKLRKWLGLEPEQKGNDHG